MVDVLETEMFNIQTAALKATVAKYVVIYDTAGTVRLPQMSSLYVK